MDGSVFVGSLFAVVFMFLALAIYCLPIIIAYRRQHPNALAILIVTLFFGWSGFGWVIALIWSCLAIKKEEHRGW